MEFCPKCGSMMRPRREAGKVELYCPNCGYVKGIGDAASSYRFVIKQFFKYPNSCYSCYMSY